MPRHSLLSPLLLGLLVLAGCGSDPGVPRGADVTEADVDAVRHSATERALQAQVTPPLDAPLRLLESPDPRYPSYLISGGIRGNVTVSIEVLPSGYVGVVQALPGSDSALHKPVIDAVRRWRFAPPVRDGKPARLHLQHTVRMAP